jgi:hypothetical protein
MSSGQSATVASMLALVAGLGSLPVSAQGPTPVPLGSPIAAFPEPFSSLSGFRELSDGRVLVADRLEKAVRMLNFGSGTLREIGRVGSGPGEYQMPGALLPLPADSTLLVDLGSMRLTAIGPDGRLGESWPMMSNTGSFRNPSGADDAGRLYFTMMGGMAAGVVEAPDSSAVVRWDRAAGAVDTVSMLPRPENVVSTRSSGGGGFQFRGAGPLSPRFGWSVSRAAEVAVVWPTDYHLELIDARGHHQSFAPVPYDPVRVTDEDKQAWADQMANATGVMMTVGGEGGSAARTIRMPRPDPSDLSWPEFKPPFDATGVRFAPDGTLWVERCGKYGAPTTVDVFDVRGTRRRRIAYPAGRRFLGFGKGTLYLVRKDADDLEWIERYRI